MAMLMRRKYFSRIHFQSRTTDAAGRDELAKAEDCPICYDSMRKPYKTKCGHVLCAPCALIWFDSSNSCPSCRAPQYTSRTAPGFPQLKAAFLDHVSLSCCPLSCEPFQHPVAGSFSDSNKACPNCSDLVHHALIEGQLGGMRRTGTNGLLLYRPPGQFIDLDTGDVITLEDWRRSLQQQSIFFVHATASRAIDQSYQVVFDHIKDKHLFEKLLAGTIVVQAHYSGNVQTLHDLHDQAEKWNREFNEMEDKQDDTKLFSCLPSESTPSTTYETAFIGA